MVLLNGMMTDYIIQVRKISTNTPYLIALTRLWSLGVGYWAFSTGFICVTNDYQLEMRTSGPPFGVDGDLAAFYCKDVASGE